ncbi:MAG: DUF58 domain-containing protein, partial [Microcystaceae cyanobacterium]
MIPTLRFYLLLTLGGAIAWGTGVIADQTIALAGMGLYDLLLIIAAIWDSQRTKKEKVQITRNHLTPLSIGRDNAVILHLTRIGKTSQILVKDDYPNRFGVSSPLLRTVLNASTTELSYTVKPAQRGQYNWGDLHLRQLGQWGLSWHSWSVP